MFRKYAAFAAPGHRRMQPDTVSPKVTVRMSNLSVYRSVEDLCVLPLEVYAPQLLVFHSLMVTEKQRFTLKSFNALLYAATA